MRADRLVAILLLLQQRGKVTADEVAAELEISSRTARRDLEALGMAGLPVYSLPGRNGGWRLAGGGRTDLSGLTASEAQALFMVAGPSAATTPQLKAALRKLVRALPEQFRPVAEHAAAATVIDERSWERSATPRRPPPPLLATVQSAVVQAQQLSMEYTSRERANTTRLVEPLGVVAKGPSWYLVADTEAGRRSFRIDRIVSATPTGKPAVRPEGFDLGEAWALIADRVNELRAPLVVTATAQQWLVTILNHEFGERLRIGTTRPDGRVEIELRGHSLQSMAGELGGYGSGVEVLEPAELRTALAKVGRDLVELYGS